MLRRGPAACAALFDVRRGPRTDAQPRSSRRCSRGARRTRGLRVRAAQWGRRSRASFSPWSCCRSRERATLGCALERPPGCSILDMASLYAALRVRCSTRGARAERPARFARLARRCFCCCR
eukprot:Amastigsp_a5093_7.p2 type:complete len:122 gc:universal Amastigsp_a5093_7:781-416(-)